MKIKAHVTIVAPDPKGATITLAPGKIADVRDDKARYLVAEGYASKASKNSEDEPTPAPPANTRSGKSNAGRRPSPEVTDVEGKDSKRAAARRRSARLGLGADDPDSERGDDGKGYGEEDDED